MRRWWPGLLLLWMSPDPAGAQLELGRADSLMNGGSLWTSVQQKAREASIMPRWRADGDSFWYIDGPSGAESLVLVDPRADTRLRLVDIAALRASVAQFRGSPVAPGQMPLAELRLSEDGGRLRFAVEGKRFEASLPGLVLQEVATGDSEPLRKPMRTSETLRSSAPGTYVGPDMLERLSPNGRWFTHIRDFNLWLRSAETNDMVQLTRDGREGDAFENAAWSPDGHRLIVVRTNVEPVHKQPVVQWLSRAQEVALLPFVQVGGALPSVSLSFVDAATGASIPVDTGLPPNDFNSFVIPLRWRLGGSEFLFMTLSRDWKRLELRAANAATGASRVILTERSDTFLAGTYLGNVASFLASLTAGDRQFIWRSERDGWSHLYLYDFDGKMVRRLTSGRFPVLGVEAVDEPGGWVYFNARAEPRVYDTNLYRVPLRHAGPAQRLTSGIGVHAAELSPSRRFIVDTYSSPSRPPVVELRRADGTLVRELRRSRVEDFTPSGWTAPEEFVAKAADGRTDLHGLIYKPYGFDATKRYPLVEAIYAGVGEQAIPHVFAEAAPDTLLLQGGIALIEALRRSGFVVVSVDGRGTPGRGKAFEDTVYGQLGRNEIPDHVAALTEAARTRPYMDLSRIGIAGASYGGFFAIRALLLAPEFYKAAVARAPGGNRLDGPQGGTEPYMGTPTPANAAAYAQASNEHLMPRLQGDLLMILGTSDMNTPFYNIRYADALANARKPYELIILPGAGHSTGSNPYVVENSVRFLVRHLQK